MWELAATVPEGKLLVPYPQGFAFRNLMLLVYPPEMRLL
jgi:hypothetical protein